MGENSTTLGDQVGSPRVVPILRFRTRFLHIRRIFVRFRHSHSHSHTTLTAQWFAILGFWDFGILGFWDFGILGFWDFGILRQYRET